MPGFTIVWLDSTSKKRRSATRSDEDSARDLARQMAKQGQADVRYRRPGESKWRAVRVGSKSPKNARLERDTPFPPTAKVMKERRQARENRPDPMDNRLPGSYERG